MIETIVLSVFTFTFALVGTLILGWLQRRS